MDRQPDVNIDPPRGLTIIRRMSEFRREETAATAIEYALIAGGIALVIIAAVALLGTSLSDFFGTLANALSGG